MDLWTDGHVLQGGSPWSPFGYLVLGASGIDQLQRETYT